MKEIKDMSLEEIITRILRVKTEDIKEQMNKEDEERETEKRNLPLKGIMTKIKQMFKREIDRYG